MVSSRPEVELCRKTSPPGLCWSCHNDVFFDGSFYAQFLFCPKIFKNTWVHFLRFLGHRDPEMPRAHVGQVSGNKLSECSCLKDYRTSLDLVPYERIKCFAPLWQQVYQVLIAGSACFLFSTVYQVQRLSTHVLDLLARCLFFFPLLLFHPLSAENQVRHISGMLCRRFQGIIFAEEAILRQCMSVSGMIRFLQYHSAWQFCLRALISRYISGWISYLYISQSQTARFH